MTNFTALQRTHFDHWQAVVFSLYFAFVGYAVLVGIPVISTAWMHDLHFTDVQVGHIASMDLGGLALGAFLMSFFIARVNRRILALLGILLAITANGISMFAADYTAVMTLRLFAGLGSGICAAVAISTLSATARPARAYNILLFIFTLFQVPEMFFLHHLSLHGIYTLLICAFLLPLPFLHWLPKYPVADDADMIDGKDNAYSANFLGKFLRFFIPNRNNTSTKSKTPYIAAWLCLLAIFFTYTNIGAYWTYIEIASLAANIEYAWVEKVLIWGSLCSIVGCLVATVLSNRFGLAKPLLVSLVLMALAVGMLSSGFTDSKVMLSIFLFNLLWIFIDVYQMATISEMDKSGKYASMMPCVQGLGQIIGPSGAAWLLAVGYGYHAIFIMGAIAAMLGMLVYSVMYVRLRYSLAVLTSNRGLSTSSTYSTS